MPRWIKNADEAANAFEHGAEIMKLVAERIEVLNAHGEHDVSETIPILAVELGGYDCALLWCVDGPLLRPVSAAFATGSKPPTDRLRGLAWDPPRLDAYELEAGMVHDVSNATPPTGSPGGLAFKAGVGLRGPIEPLLGPLGYVAAVAKYGDKSIFLLHAVHVESDAREGEEELLLSLMGLLTVLFTGPAAAEPLAGRSVAERSAPSLDGDTLQRARSARASLASFPRGAATGSDLGRLTSRELEVLKHAITGASYAAIAAELVVTVATVKSHMQSILRKLNIHSRAQLIARYGSWSASIG